MDKQALKGIPKITAKNEIKHENYTNTLETNESLNRNITSIRSFNHELFTYVQEKTALTPYYDKMVLQDKINCVPFGYISQNKE